MDVDRAQGTVALVSLAENSSQCHACSGALSVRYVKRTATGFERLSSFEGLQLSGDGFGAPPRWTVRKDLEDYPVLAVESGWTGQGCTSAGQALVELTPTGAKTRIERVPVVFDDSGAYDPDNPNHPKITSLEGKIRPIQRGRRFEVLFHGSKSLRVVYERSGETYSTKDSIPDIC